MQILICAATSLEIDSTIRSLALSGKHSVEVLIAGVGLPSTIYHLTRSLQKKTPDLIIQAGIAGALDQSLNLGEVVFVQSDFFGDLGVMVGQGFRDLFDLSFVGADEFPWKSKRLPAPVIAALRELSYKWLDSVTVNEITTSSARLQHYRSLEAGLESMEGAGLHFVGLQEGLPFLQIRSISNYAGVRDKSQWTIQAAITNLNNALSTVLEKLDSL